MAVNGMSGIAGGAGVDPRLSMSEGQIPAPLEIRHRLHDPSILLEEYYYYAKIQRDMEQRGLGPAEREAYYAGNQSGSPSESDTKFNEKDAIPETAPVGQPTIAPAEWETASRAARNASWGAVVYLITTDILGPSNAPYAISQFGYVGGTLMYTCMGIMAFYAGWMIWRMFLKIDSDRYPMRTFGDLGFRVFGTWTRHGMNILQSVQLLFNVGVIILGNGLGFSQIVKFKLCFSVCVVIWPLMGFVVGQIRTLQKFGWIANLAIWMNLFVIIVTIAVACHTLPNYAGEPTDVGPPFAPILHTVWVPPGSDLYGQVSAAMQIVYAYGGAMLYCEFMAEMRRPMDFIKAQFVAEMFIFIVYLIFGLVMYSQQGQYVFNPANQGLSPYWAQTLTNIISLLSALIAAALYGNIGIKVIYTNVLEEIFHFPPLTSKKGKFYWMLITPIYWSTAYVIASAVPQFSYISSMVAAVCIMQFTYTFPAILYVGIKVQEDAMLPEEAFNPATGTIHRVDTWRSWSRWKRGLFHKEWYFKLFNFLFFLASVATAGLGMYASAELLKKAFEGNVITSFGCHSPVDGSG